MKEEYYWNKFEKTGSITDYLCYACTSEESVNRNRVPTHSMQNIKDGLLSSMDIFQNISREEG